MSSWEDVPIGLNFCRSEGRRARRICSGGRGASMSFAARRMTSVVALRVTEDASLRMTESPSLFSIPVILRAEVPKNPLPSPRSKQILRFAQDDKSVFSFLGAAADLAQLGLLLARQQILDAHQQGQVRFLDLLLQSEDPIGLTEHTALVHRTFLQQLQHLFRLSLQLELKIYELLLRFLHFGTERLQLHLVQADLLLVGKNLIGRKDPLRDRILPFRLRARPRGCGEEKSRQYDEPPSTVHDFFLFSPSGCERA